MWAPDYIQQNTGFYRVKDRVWLQWSLFAVFLLSIAKFEGFFNPGSIAQKNNNPGNLRPVGASTGFRSFMTADEGWRALANQVMLNIKRDLTLREFFLGKPGVYLGYAPLGDNPSDVMENYISFVAESMRIPSNMRLSTFFPDIAGFSTGNEYIYVYPIS